MALDEYVTVKQLQQELNMSRSSIYQLCRRGILPQGIRLGRSRRWSIADIQAALARCEKGVIA